MKLSDFKKVEDLKNKLKRVDDQLLEVNNMINRDNKKDFMRLNLNNEAEVFLQSPSKRMIILFKDEVIKRRSFIIKQLIDLGVKP